MALSQDDRLIRIEEKIAHLEELFEQLSGVVREVADRQDALDKRVTGLRDSLGKRIEGLEAGPGGDASEGSRDLAQDKPPHW